MDCLSDLAAGATSEGAWASKKLLRQSRRRSFFAFASIDLDRTGQINQEMIWP
jgi:hypothetical protein